jgi:hypothetical protein
MISKAYHCDDDEVRDDLAPLLAVGFGADQRADPAHHFIEPADSVVVSKAKTKQKKTEFLTKKKEEEEEEEERTSISYPREYLASVKCKNGDFSSFA